MRAHVRCTSHVVPDEIAAQSVPERYAQRIPWPFFRQLNKLLSWFLASPLHELPAGMFSQIFGCGRPFHRNALHCWHRFIGTMLDALARQEAENQHQY